ncbi:hypothetical protein [Fulvivirga sp. M361]|uniref:hypothetical protein n=1 Tax=Fulvivirga sp. M361 TaxID=2594266 RepID=UPI001C869BAE|nr:hypothetical protein [Fulvivirga sp. M361]
MTRYKPHYACFNCRKTFKRRLLFDIQGGICQTDESTPAKCPECGNLMADMGLDFKSPRKSDIKAWNHLSTLYKVGITYHSCGCTGPGYIPSDSDELVHYLFRIRVTYLQHLHFWARRKEDPVTQDEINRDENANSSFLYRVPKDVRIGTKKKPKYDAGKARIYWSNQIQELDKKLELIKNANTL